MNILKRKLMLCFLKHEPPVPKLKICENILPYLRHYGFKLNDEGIVFPADCSYEQKLIHHLSSHLIYRISIPYESVIRLETCGQSLSLILRTGHIFVLDLRSSLWKIHNLYDYGEPERLTVLWWNISGRFANFRQKVKPAFWFRKKSE